MAAPTVRSSATYASAASEASTSGLTLPTGWQPGDVIYIGWELTAATGTVTTPSGWSLTVPAFVSAVGSTPTSGHTGVFRRVMQSGDTAPTISFTSGRFAAGLLAIAGADNTTPEDVTPTTDDNTGVTVPSVRAPSITPVTANCLLITFHAVRNGTSGVLTAFTPDASETEQTDTGTSVAAVSEAAIESATLTLTSAVATGTKTATATGSNVTVLNTMGVAIAVRPAAAVTPLPVVIQAAPVMPGFPPGPRSRVIAAPTTYQSQVTLSGSGTLTAAPGAGNVPQLISPVVQPPAPPRPPPARVVSAPTAYRPQVTLSGSGTLTASAPGIGIAPAVISPVVQPPTPVRPPPGQVVGAAPAATAGTAALTGSGTLTAAPYFDTSAVLSGSGTLTAAPAFTATVTLSGSGTLTASPGVGLPNVVIAAVVLPPAPKQPPPSQVIQVAPTVAFAGAVTLTGSGSLTAVPVFAGAATLSGSGTLTATAGVANVPQTISPVVQPQQPARPPPSQIIVTTPPAVFPGTATLTGSGSLTASPVFAGTAVLSGSGTLTASPVFTGTAALSGSGSLTASPAFTPVAALSGSGSLTASPAFAVAAILSGSGSLSATAPGIGAGNVVIAAVVQPPKPGLPPPPRIFRVTPSVAVTPVLTGSGTLLASPVFVITVTLSGLGQLTATGSVILAFSTGTAKAGLMTEPGSVTGMYPQPDSRAGQSAPASSSAPGTDVPGQAHAVAGQMPLPGVTSG